MKNSHFCKKTTPLFEASKMLFPEIANKVSSIWLLLQPALYKEAECYQILPLTAIHEKRNERGGLLTAQNSNKMPFVENNHIN